MYCKTHKTAHSIPMGKVYFLFVIFTSVSQKCTRIGQNLTIPADNVLFLMTMYSASLPPCITLHQECVTADDQISPRLFDFYTN